MGIFQLHYLCPDVDSTFVMQYVTDWIPASLLNKTSGKALAQQFQNIKKKFVLFFQATEEQSSTKLSWLMERIVRLNEKLSVCALQTSPEKPYHTLYYCGLGVHFGTFEIFMFPLTGIVPFIIIVYVLLFLKAHCQTVDEKVTCEGSMFWEKGFIAFQAAINAAIIEVSIKFHHKLNFDG